MVLRGGSYEMSRGGGGGRGRPRLRPAHLTLSLDDDDGHRGGRPAVLRGQRLVAVPQDDDLKEREI